MKAFSGYATRCQSLLQYGHSATDIAVSTSEEVPRCSTLPERLVPSLLGIFGVERVEGECIRLANEGQLLHVCPVGVTHSANMADPEKQVNLLCGYAYDSFNRGAILRSAKAENGRITLPDGTSYKVLVLPLARPINPEPALSSEVQKKINELKEVGILVPSLPYTEEDFSVYGLERDMIVPGSIAWTRRRGELGELYFVASQKDETHTFTASMRTNGRKPECQDLVMGEMDIHLSYCINGNRTEVILILVPNESVFIVYPAEGVHEGYGESSLQLQKEERDTAEEPLNIALEVKEYAMTFAANKKTLTRKEFFDWSQESDGQIRCYSRTTTYKTTLHWKNKPNKDQQIYLNLGAVYNLTVARVNGVDCDAIWTAPYRANITGALKKRTNKLEIEVTNTWANALTGADKGKAPLDGIWTNMKHHRAEKTLFPVGLLGPLDFSIIG